MTTEVHMDYDVVEAIADQFDTAADTLHDMNRALETAISLLRVSAFVGNVGSAALAHYLGGIQPAVTRLAATCEELSADLVGAVRALRDGDVSGSRYFIDDGSTVGGSVEVGDISDAGVRARRIGLTVAPGRPVDVQTIHKYYSNGVNGWRVIPMQGHFTPDELVVQRGPSCMIYGAMNLLIQNGHDISQTEADQIYQDQLGNADWFSRIWVDMLDGKHDAKGFPRSDAIEIIEQYGATYEHGNFDAGVFGWSALERTQAEQFLIERVGNGTPVCVATAVDNTFGMGQGGHAYTVLGVQQGDGGRLSSVLVSTNWSGGQRVYEVPADAFMDDWLELNDGEYIIITDDK